MLERFKKITASMIIALLPALAAGPALCGPAENTGVQAKEESKEELAKKVQNPVSDLVSIPYQSNFNYNYGPHNSNQYVGNLQPVVPFNASKDWNVITRTILPLVRQPELAPNVGDVWGLGDIQFTAFLSPANSGGFIWGAGPMFQFPSGTDSSITAGKYAAGPSAVVLRMDGPWVYGVLSNYISSFAGQDDHGAVSLWTTQPFINYNLPNGWYLVTSPIITDNLMAESSQRWTVPVGGGVGKVIKFGKLPISTALQGFYNVERPVRGAVFVAEIDFLMIRRSGKEGVEMKMLMIISRLLCCLILGAVITAGPARAQDASTVFTNPAGMGRLEKSRSLGDMQALYGDVKVSPGSATCRSMSGAAPWLAGSPGTSKIRASAFSRST